MNSAFVEDSVLSHAGKEQERISSLAVTLAQGSLMPRYTSRDCIKIMMVDQALDAMNGSKTKDGLAVVGAAKEKLGDGHGAHSVAIAYAAVIQCMLVVFSPVVPKIQ